MDGNGDGDTFAVAWKSKTTSGGCRSSQSDKRHPDNVAAMREQVPAGANRGRQNRASTVGVWEGRGPGRAVFPGMRDGS